MMENNQRESRYIRITPELSQKEKEDTERISTEYIKSTEDVVIKNFDKQMTSLNVYIDSLRMLVLYRLAESLHSVPAKDKGMVLEKMRDAFGSKIAIALLRITLDEFKMELEKIGTQNSQSNDFSLT